jgi:class 3 adenylate cyclase
VEIRESKLVLVTADLAGYARACAHRGALEIGTFLDAWYRDAARVIRARDGRVVKFVGDAVLAVFAEDRAVAAVDAAVELADALTPTCSSHGFRVALGANVHLAVVAEGDYGPDDDRRYDVLGSGVNHLFLMGGGQGIRISEPVYRQLPNERRDAWAKQRPPATYTLAQ